MILLCRPYATRRSIFDFRTRNSERSGITPDVGGARAVVTRFDYDSEAKIAYIMETAARAHFNMIYFHARDTMRRASVPAMPWKQPVTASMPSGSQH